MLKRLVGLAAIIAAAGVFVFGKDSCSYLRTGATAVRQAVKQEIPVEFELQRARQLVTELMPDVRRAMHVVAEQQVQCERMQVELARREKDLDQQKQVILSLRDQLATPIQPASFSLGGRNWSAEEVHRDLGLRFERFQSAETTLQADRKILTAREQSLQANRDQLDQLLHARKEAEVRLEQLQARLRTLQAAEAVAAVSVDDSRFRQTQELLQQLNTQLDVRERVLDAEGRFVGLIPLDAAETVSPQRLAERIDQHFGRGEDHVLTAKTQP